MHIENVDSQRGEEQNHKDAELCGVGCVLLSYVTGFLA